MYDSEIQIPGKLMGIKLVLISNDPVPENEEKLEFERLSSPDESLTSTDKKKSHWERSYCDFIESENSMQPRPKMTGKFIETIAKKLYETKVSLIKTENMNDQSSSDSDSSSSFVGFTPTTKNTKDPWKCSYCTFTSYDMELYSDHVEDEHTSKCPYCEYSSKRRSALKIHMYKHTGEKPHRCPYCDYRCTTSTNMIKHIRIHTGEKKYSCTICDFKCIQKSSLNTHMTVHSEIKNHVCNECSYKTNIKGNLMIHKRSHSGEKKFGCTVCPKSFTQSHNLKIHMRSHSGEKPFHCKVCNYSSSAKHNLAKHVKTHVKPKVIRTYIKRGQQTFGSFHISDFDDKIYLKDK